MKGEIKHQNDVRQIQKNIHQYIQANPNTKLAIKRTMSEYHRIHSLDYKNYSHLIDLTSLDDIVMVDEKKSIALIEPLIAMGSCCEKLLSLGYTIPVVPELRRITLGGAVSGVGVESGSHRYGCVHDCCVAYEVLLGDGTYLTISADNEYSDLFYAIPGSYGSLAILVGIWIKIIPAKPYVLLETTLDTTNQNFIDRLRSKIGQDDFLEGISYSNSYSVTIAANMTDELKPNIPFYSMKHYWCSMFYVYIKKITKKGSGKCYMTLYDYYFRHNRSLFWLYKAPDNVFIRYLLGWIVNIKFIRKLAAPNKSVHEKEKTHIIQDVVIPFNNLLLMLNDVNRTTHVYPLWLLPTLNVKTPGIFWNDICINESYFCDIGIYGKYQAKNTDFLTINRDIESKTIKYHGIKMLYARCYYSEDEFWNIFNKSQYEAIRNKYHADKYFFDIYHKIQSK